MTSRRRNPRCRLCTRVMKPHPRNARRSGALTTDMEREDLNTRSGGCCEGRPEGRPLRAPSSDPIGQRSWVEADLQVGLIGLLRGVNRRWLRLNGPLAQPCHGLSDLEGRVKNLSDREPALQAMASNRFEACRGDAAAVAAVGIAAELARHDAPLEIRRETLGRLREDAVFR